MGTSSGSGGVDTLRKDAEAIWRAAVDAVRPEPLVAAALAEPALAASLRAARRILVLGAGKAGAAMAAAVEHALHDQLERVEGLVNVLEGRLRPLARIRLNPARPAGSNQPTAQGVQGAQEMLRLASLAHENDVALCLISGGGSALLPAPADGLTLEDKQVVTQLLHGCGATIHEMNAVRKHLSAIKGGRLAQAFRGKSLTSLVISDVIGDPLDVIASGPTAVDPTTFDDALAVLERHDLRQQVPAAVWTHLQQGAAGAIADTPKQLPGSVHNRVLGNNAGALAAAERMAKARGYTVLNLGSWIEGETAPVAVAMAGLARSIKADGVPVKPPACVLLGGETTVTLSQNPGRGGRNQTFALAALAKLGEMPDTVILSGGTDGEDGPTDAAGALVDASTLARARHLGLAPAPFLKRDDAYTFLEATGDLLITGLTDTNVMDVRLFLIRE